MIAFDWFNGYTFSHHFGISHIPTCKLLWHSESHLRHLTAVSTVFVVISVVITFNSQRFVPRCSVLCLKYLVLRFVSCFFVPFEHS